LSRIGRARDAVDVADVAMDLTDTSTVEAAEAGIGESAEQIAAATEARATQVYNKCRIVVELRKFWQNGLLSARY